MSVKDKSFLSLSVANQCGLPYNSVSIYKELLRGAPRGTLGALDKKRIFKLIAVHKYILLRIRCYSISNVGRLVMFSFLSYSILFWRRRCTNLELFIEQ